MPKLKITHLPEADLLFLEPDCDGSTAALPNSSDYERDAGSPVFVGRTEAAPKSHKKGHRPAKPPAAKVGSQLGKKGPKTKPQVTSVIFTSRIEADEPVPVFFSQLPLGAFFRFVATTTTRDVHPFGLKVGKTSYLFARADKKLTQKDRITKTTKVIELPATLHVQDRIAVGRFGDPTILTDDQAAAGQQEQSHGVSLGLNLQSD